MMSKTLSIDFLYLDLDTCERCKATDTALMQALEALSGVFKLMDIEVHVNSVNIETEALAAQYAFLSSPTIRVNGVDILGQIEENECQDCGSLCGDHVDCRIFRYKGIAYEQPPAVMIADGILRYLYAPLRKTPKVAYTLPSNLNTFFVGKVTKPAKRSQCDCDCSGNGCC